MNNKSFAKMFADGLQYICDISVEIDFCVHYTYFVSTLDFRRNLGNGSGLYDVRNFGNLEWLSVAFTILLMLS